jgi:hypothetical protein
MANDDLDVDLPASAPLGRLRQRVEQTRREAHAAAMRALRTWAYTRVVTGDEPRTA